MKSQMLDHVQSTVPPKAKKMAKELTVHGDTRVDNYYWLNDPKNPDVTNYLKSENEYTERVMSHLTEFKKQLYDEMVTRIPGDDSSWPYRKNGYYYATRYESGQEYPTFHRGKDERADDEILLDQNKLGSHHEYYDINGREVSPNNQYLVFGEDTLGRRIYTLRMKDLESDSFLTDEIPNTSGYAVWANDNQTIYYTVKDETLRPYRVYRHKLGHPVEEDELIFEESDTAFYTSVHKTTSDKYVVISSHSTVSTEHRLIDADRQDGSLQLFQPRRPDLEYDIEHYDDHFYILTNYQAENFQLMKAPVAATGLENWKTVIDHRQDILIEDFDILKDFIVLTERTSGISKIRVISRDGDDHYIDFDEEVYTAYTKNNYDFDTKILRLEYTSLRTPRTTYDYDMKSKSLLLCKRREVVGTFQSTDYETLQIEAPARDGERISISIIYKKNTPIDGNSPLLLMGYGSYGISYDPTFSSIRLSLLDRGFVIAIAHIRGGEELGRRWYEDGKLMKKKNTFTDFIDCAKFLVTRNYAHKDGVFASGGSAGGLLMGAVANIEPDMWAGILSMVPFVDVITTMLDDSIPLTSGEFDEWGNPNKEEDYHYIKSYSPYDNIERKAYPPMFVTTGLHDSQVQYWEPAKYVAKMRELKTGDNPVLLHTNMTTGHSGASGRFAYLEDIAMQYAFILDLADEITDGDNSV